MADAALLRVVQAQQRYHVTIVSVVAVGGVGGVRAHTLLAGVGANRLQDSTKSYKYCCSIQQYGIFRQGPGVRANALLPAVASVGPGSLQDSIAFDNIKNCSNHSHLSAGYHPRHAVSCPCAVPKYACCDDLQFNASFNAIMHGKCSKATHLDVSQHVAFGVLGLGLAPVHAKRIVRGARLPAAEAIHREAPKRGRITTSNLLNHTRWWAGRGAISPQSDGSPMAEAGLKRCERFKVEALVDHCCDFKLFYSLDEMEALASDDFVPDGTQFGSQRWQREFRRVRQVLRREIERSTQLNVVLLRRLANWQLCKIDMTARAAGGNS